MGAEPNRGTNGHVATSHAPELVFDLLFVFTITQLAGSLANDHGWIGVSRGILLIVLLWWTFGSYASLANAAATKTSRTLLGVGIVANFFLALSIPQAFGQDRIVFAAAYAAVVLAHTLLALLERDAPTSRSRPYALAVNGIAPVLVLAGAAVGGWGLGLLWALAAVSELGLPWLVARMGSRPIERRAALTVRPDRFVQRHGVLLIILLAEAVLTIGVGLGTTLGDLAADQLLTALIALALAGTLYFAYFGEHDDDAAYAALERATPRHRELLAMLSFGYAFAVMLIGVDFAVAGLHEVIEDPSESPGLAFGSYLAAGVGVYWVGLGLFRLAFGRPFAWFRIVMGVLLSVAALLGGVSGLIELAGLLAGSVAILVIETVVTKRRAATGSRTGTNNDRPGPASAPTAAGPAHDRDEA
ncbi:MAG: low temperature requirement protein A [Micrococcales bacterium]|nr:low temperature requirement protein A [Micrococcales bacterium]